MKFCFVSSLLLLTVSGCWATFLHPFAPFGSPPPQQQFFYPPPQRNIAQEQFLLFPQLRNHFPNTYQSFNYIQTERHPFNFYNAPAAPRFPLYPNYRQSYNPVVQYIYQQTPLVSVQSNTEYGEKVPEVAVKDCNEGMEMPTAPAIVNRDPAMQSDSAMNSKVPEMQMDPKIVRKEPEMQVNPEMISKLPEMQMVPEIMNKEPEMQVESEMITKEPEMPIELEMPMEFLMISKEPAMETEIPMINKESAIPEEFITTDKSSEESIGDEITKDATNPMNLQSETKPTESMQQKSADDIAEKSTDVPASDATSVTEEILAESTTLA